MYVCHSDCRSDSRVHLGIMLEQNATLFPSCVPILTEPRIDIHVAYMNFSK